MSGTDTLPYVDVATSLVVNANVGGIPDTTQQPVNAFAQQLLSAGPVRDRIDGVDARLAAIEEERPPVGASQRVYIGAPRDLPFVDGSNASAGHIIDRVKLEGDGFVRAVDIRPNASMTIYPGLWRQLTATTFLRVHAFPGIAVTADVEARHILEGPIYEGHHLGLSYDTAGGLTTNSPAYAGGYYYAAWGSIVDGVITDADGASATNTLCYRFICDINRELEDLDLVMKAVTRPTLLGFRKAFAAGSNSGAGYFALGQLPHNGRATRARIKSGADAAVYLWFGSRIGNTFTVDRLLPPFMTDGGETTEHKLNAIGYAGESWGVYSPTAGWGVYQAGTGETPYNYSATIDGNRQFTDATPIRTAHDINIAIDFEAIDTAAEGVHETTLDGGGNIVLLGQSFEPTTYSFEGKPWPAALQTYIQHQVDVHASGGKSVAQMLEYVRTNLLLNGVRAMRDLYGATVFVKLTKNDEYTFSNPQSTVFANLRELAITLRQLGARVVLCTELDPVYGNASALAFKAVAEATGCGFMSLVPTMVNKVRLPANPDLFQGTLGGAWHPGFRSMWILVDDFVDWIRENVEAPRDVLRLFRKRPAVDPGAGLAGLVYATDDERIDRWVDILPGHRHFAPGDEGYFDRLNPSGDYAWSEYPSEKSALMAGGTVNFGTHLLAEATLDTLMANLNWMSAQVADPAVSAYLMEAIPSRGFRQLGTSNGRVLLDRSDLRSAMREDTVSLVFTKNTDMVMSRPRVFWSGKVGKPARPLQKKLTRTGTQILAKTVFDTLTGWTGAGGIAVVDEIGIGLPPGSDGLVEVTASKKATQALPFTPDATRDRRIVMFARGAYIPPLWTDPNAGGDKPFGKWTVDHRYVVLTLTDSSGYQHEFRVRVTPWWHWRGVEALIPINCSTLSLTVSGSDANVYASDVEVWLQD